MKEFFSNVCEISVFEKLLVSVWQLAEMNRYVSAQYRDWCIYGFMAVLTAKVKLCVNVSQCQSLLAILCCLLIHYGKKKRLLSILFHIEAVDQVIIGSLLNTQHGTLPEEVFTFLLFKVLEDISFHCWEGQ